MTFGPKSRTNRAVIALDTEPVLHVNPTPRTAIRRASRSRFAGPRRTVPTLPTATASETVVTWSGGVETAGTTTATEGRNGIIRWYDPITGRWLSNDPIGISGGLNQYVFAGNNPVNFRDPFGLCEKSGRPWWRNLLPDGQYITGVANLGAFGAAPFGVSIFKNDAERKIGIYGVEGFSLGWQGPYIQASLGNVHRAPTLANYAGGTASFDAAGGPFGMLGIEVGHGQTKGFSLFDPPASGGDLALSPGGAVTYGPTVGLSALPGLNVSATSATYHKAPLPSWAESALWWIVSLSPF